MDPVEGRGERGQFVGELRVPLGQLPEEWMLPGGLPLDGLRRDTGLFGLLPSSPLASVMRSRILRPGREPLLLLTEPGLHRGGIGPVLGKPLLDLFDRRFRRRWFDCKLRGRGLESAADFLKSAPALFPRPAQRWWP